MQDHLPSIDVHDYSLGVWDTKIEHKLIPYPDLVALFTSSDDDIWSRGLARYFPLPFLVSRSLPNSGSITYRLRIISKVMKAKSISTKKSFSVLLP